MRTSTLRQTQLDKLNQLLAGTWERNPFYTRKWLEAGVKIHRVSSLEDLQQFPFITRQELVADQSANPPLGGNFTGPLSALKRVHRSSGTTRAPVCWADTAQSWAWVMRCSQTLFRMAGIDESDRLFFALSFGPSSGPWIMYEGAAHLDCSCYKATTTSSREDLGWLNYLHPTVLIGKPSQLRSLAQHLELEGTRA
jgi:phenylacetate-CoA ligase